jgi:hypothetical protein
MGRDEKQENRGGISDVTNYSKKKYHRHAHALTYIFTPPKYVPPFVALSLPKANAARCRRVSPRSRTQLLAEIRLCGALLVGRQRRSRLCEVGAGSLDEGLNGCNDAGGVLALKGLGL